MADIFSVLNKFSDDELRVQIAILKQINIVNAVKETGSRLLSGIADFTDSLIKSFNMDRGISYEAVRMSDMIKKETKNLEMYGRLELIDSLKKLLYEKCGITNLYDITEERAGILIISAAANAYNIAKYETPANKIEKVSIEYNKAFLQMLHRLVVMENPTQQKITNDVIQKRMNEVSLEVKRELQRRIMPKEFSGAGIARVLRLEKKTTYLGDVVELLGEDIFDNLTAHSMAILTVVRRLKSSSKGMLAHFIWRMRLINEESFMVEYDKLPSYVTPDKEAEQIAAEKEFKIMLKSRLDTDKMIAQQSERLENLKNKQEQFEEKYNQECELYEKLDEKLRQLSDKQDKYIEGKTSDDERKQYFNDINNTKRELDRQKGVVARCSDNINNNYSLQEELSKELEMLNTKSEELHIITDEKVKEFAARLRVSWSKIYTRLVFGAGLFEAMVIEFTNKDILAIERMLYEINQSKSISSFESREGAIGVLLPNGKNAWIIYENQAIIKITGIKDQLEQ